MRNRNYIGSVGLLLCGVAVTTTALAQLETRIPTGGANVTTRKCQGGTDAGKKCKSNTECNSGNCFAYNVLDLSVNLKTIQNGVTTGWVPTAAQMTRICQYFTTYNNGLFDTTDGQFALGSVSLITNNRAPDAVLQVSSGACYVTASACNAATPCPGGQTCDGQCYINNSTCLDNSDCAAGQDCRGGGGAADTGNWGANGKMYLGIGCVSEANCSIHELMHLIANVRDEYEGAVDDGIDNDGNGLIDECNENQSGTRCFGGTNDTQPCDPSAAAPCPGGGLCRQITCIDPGPPAQPWSVTGSLMQCCLPNTGQELCTAANHDPNHDTEHSQCRDNRSTWDQFVLEWPSVLNAPAILPAPPSPSPTVVKCIQPEVIDRFVTIVDRSDSMNSESPSRINLAVNAAQDFIDFLSTGSEYALVSFASTDGGNPPDVDATKDFPSGLGLQKLSSDADRTAAKSAVGNLLSRATGFTRIGEGLRRGLQSFSENGGTPSLHSTMLLLTDGINNRPTGSAQQDLQSALNDVATAGVSMMVSCIGEARDSDQCAWLADQVQGRYVDSANSASVYDLFVDYASYAENAGIVGGWLNYGVSPGDVVDTPVTIEPGVTDLRFVLSWTDPDSTFEFTLVRPDGTAVATAQRIDGNQGQFYQFTNPPAGNWTMRVTAGDVVAGESFSVRALVKNPGVTVTSGLRKHLVSWPQGFEIYASVAAPFPVKGCDVRVEVKKPDGTTEEVVLKDDGQDIDTEKGDGFYTAKFRDLTGGSGLYTFLTRAYCSAASARAIVPSEAGTPEKTLPISSTFRAIRFAGRASEVPANLPPVAKSCHDVRAECAGATTQVVLDGTCSYDPEGGSLSYSWSAPGAWFQDPTLATPTGFFPLGVTTASLTVADSLGQSSEAPASARVVIADTIPPSLVAPSPRTVTLCNSKAQSVQLAVPTATDVCRPPTVTGRAISRNGVPLAAPIEIVNGKANLDFGSYVIEWTASDGTNSSTVTQTVDVQPSFRATDSAELADRARITSLSGTRPAFVVDGNGGINVGVETQTGTLNSQGQIVLRDRAHVWGDVTTASTLARGNNTVVDGTIKVGAPLGLSAVAYPTLPNPARLSLPTRYIQPNAVLSLPPGHYEVIGVQPSAELRIGAGTYVFDGLLLESTSRLRVDQGSGNTIVVVTGASAARGQLIQTSSAIDAFTFGYLSSNDLVLEMPFKGIVLAPNAKVVFGTATATTFVTRVWARAMQVRPDIELRCE